MRLLQRTFWFFAIMSLAGMNLQAQCALSAIQQGDFLTQNPKAKAAMIAAASADIEERVDPITSEAYYVQRVVNPWSGATTYQIVHFNAETEAFETGAEAAEAAVLTLPHGGRSLSPGSLGKTPRDSCQQRRSNNTVPVHQPRRSSTIKIAERF